VGAAEHEPGDRSEQQAVAGLRGTVEFLVDKDENIYFIEVALVLDEVGNVTMQHLLNDILLIRKENTYFFGNKNETISSVIGKNYITNTLSPIGHTLNKLLNFLDKDHALNSINYDIKIWKENNL
jgi:hypothetical protein